jgi:hypothetical protein
MFVSCISVVSNVFTTKIQLVGTKRIILSSMHIAIHQQAGCMHAKAGYILKQYTSRKVLFVFIFTGLYP